MSKSHILKRIIQFFWSIKPQEMKLFIPMAIIIFCLLFNFGALRAVKDSLVVPAVGAEVISFLKLWLVLPSAIVFTLAYVKLSNSYPIETVFYIVVMSFLLLFIFFAFVVYPNQELLHPSEELINTMTMKYPYLQWILRICGKWSYAIMYIICELWSVVVINLIYWQFTNSIFNTQDAKRFYPALGMVGNLGLVVAGSVLISCAKETNIFIIGGNCSNQLEITFKLVIVAITLFGIVAIMTFRYLNIILANRNITLSDNIDLKEKYNILHTSRTRLSLYDSINLILKSRYIRCIAFIVICYGLTINILEGPWKSKVKELYPSTQEYIHFMGQYNIFMGISCVVFMMFSNCILQRCSWIVPALVTPVIIGVTGVLFFLMIIIDRTYNTVFSNFFACDPLYLVVLIGSLQNTLSKSSKYSFFDATKEMAYLPLNIELKTKGKAAVEIVGMKLGKSGGAFVQFIIFTLYPSATFSSISDILMLVFIVVMLIWLTNIITLCHKYISLDHENI